MPVKVRISDEQLTQPGVGKALADLMMALAGDPAPEVVKPEPVA